LYGPDTGLSAGRGPHRTAGSQLDDRRLPETSRKATTVEGSLQPRIDQAQRLHQECSHARHVVLIVKRTRHTHAWAQVIRCRSARDLPSDLWWDDDCLRCPIEWNVRAAKQSWGVEDFLHVLATAVTPAAHLAWFTVNVSPHLRRDVRQRDPASGLLDLTAPCRGYTSGPETRNMLPEKPTPDVWTQIFAKVACFGRIHVVPPSFTPG
jgi:hypothetical protein